MGLLSVALQYQNKPWHGLGLRQQGLVNNQEPRPSSPSQQELHVQSSCLGDQEFNITSQTIALEFVQTAGPDTH